MTTPPSKLVTLQTHVHQGEEIYVENHKAQSWDDFVIVHIKNDMDAEAYDDLESSLNDYAHKHLDKTVIVLFNNTKVDFYGIEPYTDPADPSSFVYDTATPEGVAGSDSKT